MRRVSIVRQYNNNNGVLIETKTQKSHSKKALVPQRRRNNWPKRLEWTPRFCYNQNGDFSRTSNVPNVKQCLNVLTRIEICNIRKRVLINNVTFQYC